MPLDVGSDVAKQAHWAAIQIAETGKVLSADPVGNTPVDIAALIAEVRAAEAGHGPATWASKSWAGSQGWPRRCCWRRGCR